MKISLSSGIGIVGGAGPEAGALLFRKIIRLCQERYQCRNDEDFPYIMMLSYPFTDMLRLKAGKTRERLERQLQECLDTFKQQRQLSIVAIACNTLHEFLKASETTLPFNLVNMIRETASYLEKQSVCSSLILCTRTSAQCQLHRRYFSCQYPNEVLQQEVENVIDRVLAGNYTEEDTGKLALLVEKTFSSHLNEPVGIVLGCTELSILNDRFPFAHYLSSRRLVIDPAHLVAEKICHLIYQSYEKEEVKD